MSIDSNVAAVHAYLCADGYVVKNLPSQPQKYYRIGLRNTNKTLLQDFKDALKVAFQVEAHMRTNRCEIGSKELYYKFVKTFGSFYSREWKMMKNLDKKSYAAWLRAFFDCEGWVQARIAKSRAISAESVNYNGLLQIQKVLLCEFNINSKLNKRKHRSTWVLNIYGKENIEKFAHDIGFLHEKKKDKLKNAIESYRNYTWMYSNSDAAANIREIMLSRARVKKPRTIRVTSSLQSNLDKLKEQLYNFGIKSKVYGPRTSSSNSKYYELYIYDRESREKLISNGCLSNVQIEKLKGVDIGK